MDSYLSGRGFDVNRGEEDYSTEFKSLGSLMDLAKKTISSEDSAVSNESEASTQVIYEEKDAPRVEVVSVDDIPSEIIISMVDGKILRIACDY
jgi:hypothetical protein